MHDHEDLNNSIPPQANILDSIASQELCESSEDSGCQSHSIFLRSVAIGVLLLGGTAYGTLMWMPELALRIPFIPDTTAVSNLPSHGACSSCSANSSPECGCHASEEMIAASSAAYACSTCAEASSCQCAGHCDSTMVDETVLNSSESKLCSCSECTKANAMAPADSACQSCSTVGGATCDCTSVNSGLVTPAQEQSEALPQPDVTVLSSSGNTTIVDQATLTDVTEVK